MIVITAQLMSLRQWLEHDRDNRPMPIEARGTARRCLIPTQFHLRQCGYTPFRQAYARTVIYFTSTDGYIQHQVAAYQRQSAPTPPLSPSTRRRMRSVRSDTACLVGIGMRQERVQLYPLTLPRGRYPVCHSLHQGR